MRAGDLNRRVTFQAPVHNTAPDSAGSDPWTTIATVCASVVDILPSRGDRVADGIDITTRPARIRIRYRTDITPAMRVIFGSRTMKIIAGPAILGNREGLEIVAEEYNSAGNAA